MSASEQQHCLFDKIWLQKQPLPGNKMTKKGDDIGHISIKILTQVAVGR